jgi:nucleoid-associated protein
LGCEEGIDAKQQSAVLLEAVEEFIQTTPAEADQKADTRKEVLKYCTERVQLGEDASIRDLTELFQESPAVPEVPFDDFSVQKGYSLEERFPVDRKTMTALVKFSGQGGGVSVGFERKLLGESVFYDQASDTLTIKKIPANLRDQIIRYLNNQNHPFMDE